MKTELEELKVLVDEMAVLWVTQHPANFDIEGKTYGEAFDYVRTHPRFNAMIMTAWMSGRWYQESLETEDAAVCDCTHCQHCQEGLEPVGDVIAAFGRGEKGVTERPVTLKKLPLYGPYGEDGFKVSWPESDPAAETGKDLASGGIIKGPQRYLLDEN